MRNESSRLVGGLCASFVLPTSAAVSSVAWDGEYLYAVDGITPWVFVFTADGLFLERYRTVRSYRTVRYDEAGNRFLATDITCSGTVYVLNGRFEEIGPVRLETQTVSDRAVSDAGYGAAGFDITHPYALTVYAADGSYVTTVTRAPYGRTYVSWADYAGTRALCYTERSLTYLSANGERGILPACVSFRSFIPDSGNISVALGYGTLYTYVVPFVTGGIVNSAVYGNFALLINNISLGCCN